MLPLKTIVDTTLCNRSILASHYQSLVNACGKYNINSPERISAFLANSIYETAGFNHLTENLSYKSPERIIEVFRKFDLNKDRFPDLNEIEFAAHFVKNPVSLANFVYARRFGNTLPDDGWKFRGRGMFCITFHDNYLAVSKALGFDFIAYPDALSLPPFAALSAAYFWHVHHLNELADKADFLQITKTISGSSHTHQERMLIYNKLIKCFNHV